MLCYSLPHSDGCLFANIRGIYIAKRVLNRQYCNTRLTVNLVGKLHAYTQQFVDGFVQVLSAGGMKTRMAKYTICSLISTKEYSAAHL